MLRIIFSFLSMLIALIFIAPLLVLISPVWLFVSLCKGLNELMISSKTTWDKIIEYEPDIGWKPMPGLDNIIYYDDSGDKGSITTGDEGWPGKHTIEESEVVVFGDSFAFGFGSEFQDTYYTDKNKIRIKPVAAPGYNMVQGLLLMKKYKQKLHGKLIVWLICLENDLAENIQAYNSMQYRNPFLKKKPGIDDWEIVNSHINREMWFCGETHTHNTLKFATICSPSEYTEKVMSGCKYLIEEANAICESVGAELLLFTIPDKRLLTSKGIHELKKRLSNDSKFNEDLPDKLLGQICDELNITLIPGKKYLNIHDYKVRDPHWNRKGNQKLSLLINENYHKIIYDEIV